MSWSLLVETLSKKDSEGSDAVVKHGDSTKWQKSVKV